MLCKHFQSQKLMVSTVDVNAVGLGTAILYQSYFVCLKETSKSTVIEYGKSLSTTESGDVYLTMLDRDDPYLSVSIHLEMEKSLCRWLMHT